MFRRALPIFLLTLFCLLASIGASADENRSAAASVSLPQSEELVYQAELSRSLIRGLDVAEFRLIASRDNGAAGEQNQNAPQLHLHVEIRSKGMLRSFFGLRFYEYIESTVEPGSFLVLKTKKVDEQGERRRESETVYDRNAHKLIWTEFETNNPSRPPRVITTALNEETQDMASLIYYLRARQLAVGQSFEVPVNDSGRIYHVPVRVTERKKMKSPLGETFALRVEPEMFGEDRPLRGQGQIIIWLTDDEKRIPVQANIKTSAGTLNIKLKSFTSSSAPAR